MEDAQKPEDDFGIGNEEFLLRRVHPDLAKSGKPDRSTFKDDPGGVGTSVTVWRSAADLERVIGERNHVGVVAVTAGEARALGLKIAFTFEEGNPNHCEIFGPRTKGAMGKLRDGARWVKYPEGFPEESECDLFDPFAAGD